jgi:hypothetical protein
MDDPALEQETCENEILAELRDIRAWFAEQRAKYGMDWVDNSPPGCSEYERSRGLVPGDAFPK